MGRPHGSTIDLLADLAPGPVGLAAAVIQRALAEDRSWFDREPENVALWADVAGLDLATVRAWRARRRSEVAKRKAAGLLHVPYTRT